MSCILALTAVFTATAQVPASVQPGRKTTPENSRSETHSRKLESAGAPILGYVLSNGGTGLEPIAGRLNAPKLGEPVALPAHATRVYLPPRQLFALVEASSDEALQVWTLSATRTFKNLNAMLPQVTAHPDLVAFSPRGTAALVYSRSNLSVETLTHLPAEPAVGKPLILPDAPASLAVSDDGQSILMALADGRMLWSMNGGAWTNVSVSLTPKAWTFVPNSHDVVISDVTRKLIVVVPEPLNDFRILDQDVEADQLAFTKGGEQLVAGSSTGGRIWTMDIRSGQVAFQDAVTNLASLTPLRDGFTFLISTSPTLSVLRFSPSESN